MPDLLEILTGKTSSLVKDGRARFLNPNESETLAKLFPTTFAVESHFFGIVVRVKQLPPKPWPFAIGGYPLFVTTCPCEEGFNSGLLGGRDFILDEWHNCVNEKFKALSMRVFGEFAARGIELVEVGWHGGFFRLQLRSMPDKQELPGKIANRPVFYVLAETDNTVYEAFGRMNGQLTGTANFADMLGVKMFDKVHFNCPVNGLCPGLIVARNVRRTVGDRGYGSAYVHTQYLWFGNGNTVSAPTEVVRGAAIIHDKTNQVISFFHSRDGVMGTSAVEAWQLCSRGHTDSDNSEARERQEDLPSERAAQMDEPGGSRSYGYRCRW